MNLKNKTKNHILKLSKSTPNLTFESSIFKQVVAHKMKLYIVVASRIRWSTLLLDGWTRDSQHTKGS